MLEQLHASPKRWVPLHELIDDYDDLDWPDRDYAMSSARAAVRGLERRGLVETFSMTDYDKHIATTVVMHDGDIATPADNILGARFEPSYSAMPTTRTWFGMHVRLLDRD
jgi:hypothetical protein